MIAPDRGGSNGETSRRRLLRHNLAAVTLVFFALQIWRPYFFLTDDNLDGGLPFFIEVGRHLLAGRSPCFSDYLFGGHYDYLRDPTYFVWHPFYLLASLLEATPLRYGIIDAVAFGFILLGAAGFVNLAWQLRREYALPLGDGWIMFYTLSFSYSMIALTTGASWLNFLGAQSALPWLAFGILQRSWRASLGLVTLFAAHLILGSHPEPAISNVLFLSLFAVGIAWARRSWQPVLCWGAGFALAALLLLPLVLPLTEGFFASSRSHGIPLVEMSRNNIPPGLFLTSIFLGDGVWIINPPIEPNVTYTLAVGSAAAAWCSLGLISFRRRWEPLEKLLVGLVLLAALVVVRPQFVSEIMVRLPLLKSMRWPFRELLQFQFFLHLLLLVRPSGFPARGQRRLAVFSTLIYLVPMLAYKIPPTFNTMRIDRELVLHGGLDAYWRQVRPLLQPGDRVAAIIPREFYAEGQFELPFSLLNAFNYPCLTRCDAAGGYSQTSPRDQLYVQPWSIYPFGAWEPDQEAELRAERPDLKFIAVESISPLKITLSSATGAVIDLTPYVPENVREEVAAGFVRGRAIEAEQARRAQLTGGRLWWWRK
jgi:hypothetical protein